MKNKSVIAALGMITQFGLSTLTPMLLCILGAVWLKARFSLGDWVVLVGVLLGAGSGFLSMLKMIRSMAELSKKEDGDESGDEKTA